MRWLIWWKWCASVKRRCVLDNWTAGCASALQKDQGLNQPNFGKNSHVFIFETLVFLPGAVVIYVFLFFSSINECTHCLQKGWVSEMVEIDIWQYLMKLTFLWKRIDVHWLIKTCCLVLTLIFPYLSKYYWMNVPFLPFFCENLFCCLGATWVASIYRDFFQKSLHLKIFFRESDKTWNDDDVFFLLLSLWLWGIHQKEERKTSTGVRRHQLEWQLSALNGVNQMPQVGTPLMGLCENGGSSNPEMSGDWGVRKALFSSPYKNDHEVWWESFLNIW